MIQRRQVGFFAEYYTSDKMGFPPRDLTSIAPSSAKLSYLDSRFWFKVAPYSKFINTSGESFQRHYSKETIYMFSNKSWSLLFCGWKFRVAGGWKKGSYYVVISHYRIAEQFLLLLVLHAIIRSYLDPEFRYAAFRVETTHSATKNIVLSLPFT